MERVSEGKPESNGVQTNVDTALLRAVVRDFTETVERETDALIARVVRIAASDERPAIEQNPDFIAARDLKRAEAEQKLRRYAARLPRTVQQGVTRL